MIHQKNDAGVGIDSGQRFVVGITQADAIENLQDAPCQVKSNTEIDVDIEGRHDFTRVASHLSNKNFSRHAGRACFGLNRLDDLGVVGQTIDQDTALRLLERGNLQLQPGIELADKAVDATCQNPAQARNKQAVENCPESEGTDNHHNPDWKGDLFRHLCGQLCGINGARGFQHIGSDPCKAKTASVGGKYHSAGPACTFPCVTRSVGEYRAANRAALTWAVGE